MKPLFQKRHYEVIAKGFKNGWWGPGKEAVISDFIAILRADNPKFNEDKFWRAINGQGKG